MRRICAWGEGSLKSLPAGSRAFRLSDPGWGQPCGVPWPEEPAYVPGARLGRQAASARPGLLGAALQAKVSQFQTEMIFIAMIVMIVMVITGPNSSHQCPRPKPSPGLSSDLSRMSLWVPGSAPGASVRGSGSGGWLGAQTGGELAPRELRRGGGGEAGRWGQEGPGVGGRSQKAGSVTKGIGVTGVGWGDRDLVLGSGGLGVGKWGKGMETPHAAGRGRWKPGSGDCGRGCGARAPPRKT